MNAENGNPPQAPKERAPYEAPAVVFEEVMEAMASSCADCDITGSKSSAGTCAITSQACVAPFNS